MKRKRANRECNVAIPDGNYTPSDSDSDDDESNRKIIRRRPSNDSSESNDIDRHEHEHEQLNRESNNQLLYAALSKIQELENELAELDAADYDSGHHDDDEDIDEGNASDFDENIEQHLVEQHDHRDEILNGQAEALGFAFCVKETFDYLSMQGVTDDSPIVAALRERFLGQCEEI